MSDNNLAWISCRRGVSPWLDIRYFSLKELCFEAILNDKKFNIKKFLVNMQVLDIYDNYAAIYSQALVYKCNSKRLKEKICVIFHKNDSIICLNNYHIADIKFKKRSCAGYILTLFDIDFARLSFSCIKIDKKFYVEKVENIFFVKTRSELIQIFMSKLIWLNYNNENKI